LRQDWHSSAYRRKLYAACSCGIFDDNCRLQYALGALYMAGVDAEQEGDSLQYVRCNVYCVRNRSRFSTWQPCRGKAALDAFCFDKPNACIACSFDGYAMVLP
jgi:hypothetical protein